MYEIFSDREIQDLQRSNHQRRSIDVKGGCILKSKGSDVLKKKNVFADLSNIMRHKNEAESLIDDDHQISNLSACDKKSKNVENDNGKGMHQRLYEKVIAEKNIFPGASCEVPNYLLDAPYLYSESILFDESSNSTFGENSRIEEDVFFGTYYSISEDERELISTANWDMDTPETMSGYCSEEGSCDTSYDDRWLEKPLWKTSEGLHQIVEVPETSKCETLMKLEDMEFTSFFAEIPSSVKTTLDVPDVLFGSDYENDGPKIPVPDLEW
ncbi:uncharacterized protein LOC126335543 isoform X1 [Schistocerca gregaria]|uniref:uncharacterized protein LOC126335543 isoform X1 n=1 Tax=Schistocerca gregaria TaxID=7010 RepID=UPI00211E8825|nr:uncharacterized protein LOC126335543 isoform X1 [Schistocerca gregaria]